MKTLCYNLYDVNFTLSISVNTRVCLKPAPDKSDNFKKFLCKIATNMPFNCNRLNLVRLFIA